MRKTSRSNKKEIQFSENDVYTKLIDKDPKKGKYS